MAVDPQSPEGSGRGGFRFGGSLGPVLLSALIATAPGLALAGVQFENCVTGSDGSLSCDTVPTGNTLLNDVEARYGLLQNASPGWSEFDPYQGYDDDFGDNQT
jgi:hypothetical protein